MPATFATPCGIGLRAHVRKARGASELGGARAACAHLEVAVIEVEPNQAALWIHHNNLSRLHLRHAAEEERQTKAAQFCTGKKRAAQRAHQQGSRGKARTWRPMRSEASPLARVTSSPAAHQAAPVLGKGRTCCAHQASPPPWLLRLRRLLPAHPLPLIAHPPTRPRTCRCIVRQHAELAALGEEEQQVARLARGPEQAQRCNDGVGGGRHEGGGGAPVLCRRAARPVAPPPPPGTSCAHR